MTALHRIVVLATLVTSGPALAQYTDGVIKIGVLTDMSGVYSELAGPGSVAAARLAVADFGAAAKGMRVEIISGDMQNKPDVGVNIATSWFDVEKVDVIFDLPNSTIALAVSEIARQKNKLLIAVGTATSDLTGAKCNANTIHWLYDTWSNARGTGKAMVKSGGDTWFFVTVDYAFGQAAERDTTAAVEANGGRVVGKVRHPLNTSDFSSFLLQAQASKAKVVGLANGGSDTVNAIKQAAEFGIVKGGQKLAGMFIWISDVAALGLQVAQGLVLTESYYWDLNDRTREFGERYFKRTGRMPNMVQAGMYSATLQYLKAVKAAGTKDADAVAKKLKELPVNDAFTSNGHVQANGRMVSDLYLFEVKKPSESKRDWDFYNLLATVPGDTAYLTAANSGCPLTK